MGDDLNVLHKEVRYIRKLASFVYQIAPRLIIFIAIAIRIPLLFASEEYGFTQTTWRQTDTASIAHNFLDSRLQLLYPQINWGGNGPGYVETEFPLYPFLVALTYRVFGEHVWLGLLVSLLFSAGTYGAFYLLAQQLLHRSAAIIALIFFVFVPMNIRYSVVFMPEPTAFFFYVTAIWLFYKWLAQENLYPLILAASSTALAILVKPTTVHIGFIFLFMLLQKYRLQTFTRWQVWLFAIISLLPGILWYLHARGLYLTYGNTFGIISGGDNKFDNLAYWFSPSFYYSVAEIEIQWVFTVVGILPFILGLVLIWQRRNPMLVIYGMIAQIIYYLLIPRYISFAVYYHIYALPFVALAVGIGIHWFLNDAQIYLSRFRIKILMYAPHIVSIVILLLFIRIARINYYQILDGGDQPYWECSQYVDELVPANALVIISSNSRAIENGVPNNFEKPNLFFYSHRYGWSLSIENHTPEKIHQLQALGAEYFVLVDHSILLKNPALLKDLQENAKQIGPGPQKNCSIYQLEQNP